MDAIIPLGTTSEVRWWMACEVIIDFTHVLLPAIVMYFPWPIMILMLLQRNRKY